MGFSHEENRQAKLAGYALKLGRCAQVTLVDAGGDVSIMAASAAHDVLGEFTTQVDADIKTQHYDEPTIKSIFRAEII